MANLLHHNTASFLRFVERFIAGEDVHKVDGNKTYAIMLYYALFQDKISKTGYNSINEALELIHLPKYACFKQEIAEIVSFLLARLDIKTTPIGAEIIPGLELYGCYTREEVFTLVGRQTAEVKMQGAASGVFNLPEHNATLLFVTLNKSEKDFSPSTQYNDYLINEEYFHWQSQNTDSHNNNGGRRYTEQEQTKNKRTYRCGDGQHQKGQLRRGRNRAKGKRRYCVVRSPVVIVFILRQVELTAACTTQFANEHTNACNFGTENTCQSSNGNVINVFYTQPD